MRLLYLVNARLPTEKAHGLQIVKTIEAIGKLGINTRLVIPRRKNHIKTKLETFYNLTSKIDAVYVPDPLRIVQIVSESIYFPLQRLWFGIVALVYGIFWPGIIYSRDITISFLLSLFGKSVAYEDHQPKQRRLYAFFLRAIPYKIVVARNLGAEYEAMHINKESYIYAPNGVDLAEFDRVSADKTVWNREFGIPVNMPVALYAGHFYGWKGVHALLDAAKNIQASIVLIGGTAEDYEAMEQYIKEQAIFNAYLRKFMPHREVIRFIKSADVLVLPNTAQEERSQKYTTPIKLFEYMASGVPIAASNILSFSPYLAHQENALLFEPDDPDDLARTVNQLIQDRNLGNKLSRAARLAANRYSWDARAETIIDFLKRNCTIYG